MTRTNWDDSISWPIFVGFYCVSFVIFCNKCNLFPHGFYFSHSQIYIKFVWKTRLYLQISGFDDSKHGTFKNYKRKIYALICSGCHQILCETARSLVNFLSTDCVVHVAVVVMLIYNKSNTSSLTLSQTNSTSNIFLKGQYLYSSWRRGPDFLFFFDSAVSEC